VGLFCISLVRVFHAVLMSSSAVILGSFSFGRCHGVYLLLCLMISGMVYMRWYRALLASLSW